MPRAELSPKNPYYLPKYRKYELKYYCYQYPEWERAYNEIRLRTESIVNVVDPKAFMDYTAEDALRLKFYADKMKTIKNAAIETDEELDAYILIGVTQNKGYPYMSTHYNIPVSQSSWYRLLDRFYWILSQYKD